MYHVSTQGVDECMINVHHVGEWGGEWWKQAGSMDEESQVRGCYNITFICTNQETVRLSPESDA